MRSKLNRYFKKMPEMLQEDEEVFPVEYLEARASS